MTVNYIKEEEFLRCLGLIMDQVTFALEDISAVLKAGNFDVKSEDVKYDSSNLKKLKMLISLLPTHVDYVTDEEIIANFIDQEQEIKDRQYEPR